MNDLRKGFFKEATYYLTFLLTLFVVILLFFSQDSYAQTLQGLTEGKIPQLGTKDLAIMGSTMVFDFILGKSKKIKSNSLLEALIRIGKFFVVGLISKNLKSWLVFALMIGTGFAVVGCSSTERKETKEAIREHLKSSGKAFLCTEVIKKCSETEQSIE